MLVCQTVLNLPETGRFKSIFMTQIHAAEFSDAAKNFFKFENNSGVFSL